MFEPKNKKEVGFLEEHAGEGFENITQEDLKIPFLRILQKGSPQVDKDDTNYIKGAEPGMFFNTVTQKLYGKEIKVIPIKYQKLWMEWKPDRGGLVARHEPESINVDKSDFSRWTYNGNNITETLFFYVMLSDHMTDGPMVFALSSTGIKHGKNWNSQIVHTRLPSGKQAPYFSSVWKLSSVACKNDKGTWYQIGDNTTAVKRVRYISSEDYTNFVSPNRESLSKNDIDYKQLEDQATQKQIADSPY